MDAPSTETSSMDGGGGGSSLAVENDHDGDESSWSRHVETDDDLQGDDDEDNWSRQVQTDEIQRMPSSVTGDATNTMDDDDDGSSSAAMGQGSDAIIPPQREEPTLKEKLVERERQRRVETERARWKRQFAMAAHSEADDEEENYHHNNNNNNSDGVNSNGDAAHVPNGGDADESAMRETNSVAGTVGEDTVAPIETLEEEKLEMNYPMERFLQEQENSMQQQDSDRKKEASRDSATNQGVVMERFLQETPVVVVDQGTQNGETPTNVQRSVWFDTEHPQAAPPFLNMSTVSSSIADTSTDHGRGRDAILESQGGSGSSLPVEIIHSVAGSVANASTTCLPPSEDDHDNTETIVEIPATSETTEEVAMDLVDESSATTPIVIMSEPESPSGQRVLRLTEAEIQEMAAIDEASRSNAPPSERDDMSELGELVSDFGGPPHMMDHPNNSQGTPTTAMESASSVANHSGIATQSVDDQLSIDAMGTASVSSNIIASSAGGDVSVTANPPSDIIRDDDDDVEDQGPRNIVVTGEMIPVSPPPVDTHEPTAVLPGDTSLPQLESTNADRGVMRNDGGSLGQYIADENIVNRTMRPGLFNYRQNQEARMLNSTDAPLSRHEAPLLIPNRMSGSSDVQHIEGFDFDKDDGSAPQSPATKALLIDPSIQNDLWSSGLSPSRPSQSTNSTNNAPSIPSIPDYGTHQLSEHDMKTQRFGSSGRRVEGSGSMSDVVDSEGRPLLAAIPREVHARDGYSLTSLTSIRTMDDAKSLAESVFSDLRSDGTSTVEEVSNEAKEYLESSIWKRAFPERLFALTVTLLLEIPVLLMVSGGSDRLCYLIGRTKYQLLIGFLPLSSAISGNVGLQSSTLTTRAISHGQVKVSNYKSWLLKEIGAALYLGIGMGGFLGLIAFVASGYSFPFGLTVMIAQFISILTAGCTGTFAPLLFTFIFERDSGKWGGPLETAVQDIVGSFAMVIISYHLLVWLGPFDISEDDMCGAENLE